MDTLAPVKKEKTLDTFSKGILTFLSKKNIYLVFKMEHVSSIT